MRLRSKPDPYARPLFRGSAANMWGKPMRPVSTTQRNGIKRWWKNFKVRFTNPDYSVSNLGQKKYIVFCPSKSEIKDQAGHLFCDIRKTFDQPHKKIALNFYKHNPRFFKAMFQSLSTDQKGMIYEQLYKEAEEDPKETDVYIKRLLKDVFLWLTSNEKNQILNSLDPDKAKLLTTKKSLKERGKNLIFRIRNSGDD